MTKAPNMSDIKQPSLGFDLNGAAHDHESRKRRWAHIMGSPDIVACYGLIARNPAIAPAVLRAIQGELARLPDGGVGLEVPLSFVRHNGVA